MTPLARWQQPPEVDGATLSSLSGELGCPTAFAQLLGARGLETPEAAREFLAPRLAALSDPFRLPQMQEAVSAILAALDANRRIVLYGDYDVDGVTSLAMLTRLLCAYGGKRVASFLPHRVSEGYGVTLEGIRRCQQEHAPELLIALDCGTSSATEIAELATQGISVVVVDHHDCPEQLPQCVALVNPKRRDALYPEDADLCTAGLVFKLCHALLKARPLPGFDLKEMLDLAALGTVADIVPLRGENRILVRRGLLQLTRSRWPGVRALIEVARVSPPFSAGQVGFQLAPRLNAAGRLGTAEEALRLLLTDQPGEARTLAATLDQHNRQRQQVEQQTLDEAQAQLGTPDQQYTLVLGGDGWHPGVLGIVAARISRLYHRPTWVIGFDEDGLGKGSGRSIDGAPLVSLLAPCAPHLERYGGHAMAAGLTMRRGALEPFRAAFETAVRAHLDAEALLPRVRPDVEVTLAELNDDLLCHHEGLQPFGMGNPQPLFVVRGVSPAGPPVVMKEKHLRLTLRQGATRQEAVFFNTLPDALPRPPWDIAVRIAPNHWQGQTRLQLLLQHIRSTPA